MKLRKISAAAKICDLESESMNSDRPYMRLNGCMELKGSNEFICGQIEPHFQVHSKKGNEIKKGNAKCQVYRKKGNEKSM